MLLRPRQTEFVDRTLAALHERGNTLAVAPTGFGKTVALAAIVGRLFAAGGRALVLQHRQELVAQNVEKFLIINPALPASVVDAAAKDFSGRAIFAMVPTLNDTITATLIDAETVEAGGKTRQYKRPVYDLARALIREGHDPEVLLVTRWKGSGPAFKPAPLRVFAKWTAQDSDRTGLRLRPYEEWPAKVAGQPVQRETAHAA